MWTQGVCRCQHSSEEGHICTHMWVYTLQALHDPWTTRQAIDEELLSLTHIPNNRYCLLHVFYRLESVVPKPSSLFLS